MGIQQVLTAARSPWQNPFAERLIGSIRRECLNHIIVLGERHLRWTLKRYVRYYLDSRSHLSLEKDSPNSRPVQSVGEIVQSLKSVGCTIDTSVVPHDPSWRLILQLGSTTG